MTKRKRMQYKGPSTDIRSNPWIRLVHGRHYEIEPKELSSGRIRVRVFEDIDVARITYRDKEAFDREWC